MGHDHQRLFLTALQIFTSSLIRDRPDTVKDLRLSSSLCTRIQKDAIETVTGGHVPQQHTHLTCGWILVYVS